MKKLLAIVLSLILLCTLSACTTEITDGTVRNAWDGMHVVESYVKGNLVSVQIYDLSSCNTTIYTYNYVYDMTLFCESVNVLVLDKDGTVITQYVSADNVYGGK